MLIGTTFSDLHQTGLHVPGEADFRAQQKASKDYFVLRTFGVMTDP